MNSKLNNTLTILAGITPLTTLHLPVTNTSVLIAVYSTIVIIAFGLVTYINKQNPYHSASLIVVGTFIGSIIEIAFFPTINGFERNLFPIEILSYTLFSAIISFVCATVWYYAFTKTTKNT